MAALSAFILDNAVAIFAALLAVWTQFRVRRDERRLGELERERERLASRVTPYREPLARAVFDLQSRLFNIGRRGFIEIYFVRGDEGERAYAVDSTAFLVAQHFAWQEIIRREVQLLDLGRDDETRRLVAVQGAVMRAFRTDGHRPLLRVFAVEQRAIGERLIVERGGRLDCMGYGAFLELAEQAPDPLTVRLREDVRALAERQDEAMPRIKALHHALIDLLELLDPDFVRFPRDVRTKL